MGFKIILPREVLQELKRFEDREQAGKRELRLMLPLSYLALQRE